MDYNLLDYFIKFSLYAIYILLIFFTIKRLKGIDSNALTFSDGVLVGCTFYISIPLFLIFINGSLYSYGILVKPYLPFEDIKSTMAIFLGWTVILFAHLDSKKYKPRRTKTDNSKVYFIIMVSLYFIFSIYSYIKAGMLSQDAHWHESLVTSLGSDTSLIIIKNFAFAYRTMLFGIILYLFKHSVITRKEALLYGGLLASFDVITTYNRITLLYYFFLIFIIYIKHWKLILLSLIVAIPFIAEISNFMTIIRGSTRGGDFAEAIFIASTLKEDNIPFIIKINGIFESSNILVLTYIVNNIGEAFPVMNGNTFFVRPLTTFIPSSIWEGKPSVFGTHLGKYINGHDTLTLNSTFFGEAIGNFYYFWPIILLGTIMGLNRLFLYIENFIPSIGFMAFFVGIALWRFDMNFVSISIYAIILILLIRNGWFLFAKLGHK